MSGDGSGRLTLVLATANPDKVSEIESILSSQAIDLLPRPPGVDDVEETGETLRDNARLKARALLSATGMAAVADDTGLEVEALGGAPGVCSARFAGEVATYADNVDKLLEELATLPGSGRPRRARFRTVALAAFPDGTEVVAEGTVEGRIAERPSGTAGFGYDSVFVPDEGDGRTFAEMSPAEKHACSHRGRAFRSLAAELAARARG
ncbi:MAG TPA: RdgB/HAM1 family non-canonical purine NTP pyrophosphatase [Acidimicrobiales bacterium]|nr:RdgB/HAM1 family non-canonical purine NTP pyrophosphatase [Acidimicrobiales bacterium]